MYTSTFEEEQKTLCTIDDLRTKLKLFKSYEVARTIIASNQLLTVEQITHAKLYPYKFFVHLYSYRLTDESNNPVYESIEKDLDIKSNEEQQALQPNNPVYESVEKDLEIKSDEEQQALQSNNPVYETADKNLDIKSNEEQQALQPAHVYHELEDPQSPTSCTHEYSTPYDTSIPNSDGPKITPALNDTDCLTHFNELYEAS